ncbi:MFS transporter [Nocardioides mesophilus]|uniref:MFS transporter n=1 Tax=Nocardioides mesophilus TaxID=433659 RepID=A0A7G9RGI6_9ACTN|nr:MFS transporter [Nocardioides mesophilus]QNN54711.1 MFS transporter [Nocardioides mesophilus]
MRTYTELFAFSEFRVLFISTCLNVGASSMASLALGTITFTTTDSAALTALAMFGGPLVTLLGSTLLLSASDLLRPRFAILLIGALLTAVNAVQALPDLPLAVRFVLVALPFLAMSATAGSGIAVMSEILPPEGFVLGRSTLNIAVGVMQIVGYGTAGLLLLVFSTSELFLAAASTGAISLVLVRLGLRERPARATGPVVKRTRTVNRQLLGSRLLRPIYLCLWVPNGLIVGCEALFVPYAGQRAGFLFASAAAGMLVGDVVVGRFLSEQRRDRLIEPLRLLLAAPFLVFWLVPGLGIAIAAAFLASIGYGASLPLQERLLAHTTPDQRGHVLGLRGTGMMVMQGVGAGLGGLLSDVFNAGVTGTAYAMGILAVASLIVTATLTPGLRRSRPTPVSDPLNRPPSPVQRSAPPQ